MLALRSLAYNVVFYVAIIFQMLFWTPLYFVSPRRIAWFVPDFWANTNIWLLEKIVGVTTVVEGAGHLPAQSYILAPKHQSFVDVMTLFPLMRDPVFILKRELMLIPLFGWYVGKMDMIPVRRGDRAKALRGVVEESGRRIAEGREIIIYPEGTRRPPGAPPAYKYGIVELYARLGLPVVPVAHNAGLFWPRRKFMRYPGRLVFRILPAIPAGLPKDEFQARLIETIETGCDALLLDLANDPVHPPFPPLVVDKLAALRAGQAST